MDIVIDGFIEQHRILGDHTDGATQAHLCAFPYILPIDYNPPFSDVIKAEKKPPQRGLPRARGTDHRHLFTGRDFETNIFEYRAFGLVGKFHMVKLNMRLFDREILGVGDDL